VARSLRARRPFPPFRRSALLAAGVIFAFAAGGARAGFDGWRGDFNTLFESEHPAYGYYYPESSYPGLGWSGSSDWQWHWIRSGTWIRAGVYGEYVFPLFEEKNPYRRVSRGWVGVRDLNAGIPFGDPASGFRIQLGYFPIRPGESPDLFGNYVARYQPYPGEAAYPPRASDSLGATGEPALALRAAFGGARDPLRSEFFLLKEEGGLSLLAYLDGALANGFDWGLGAGWRHAFAWDKRGRSDRWTVWAKTDQGYLPIGFALDTGMAISEAGGISAKGWTLSARLRWMAATEALGRYGAFGEAGLLGLENQPLFYEDRWRRLAGTAGAYLPTGGLLQVCLIQMEWRPGGYHWNEAIRANSAQNYVQPADAVSPWSYAALVGRDFGRHWALRGSLAYAPRLWSAWINQEYDPAVEPVYPYVHRGKRELAARLRVVFRFGARE
jgi:hypothetical protein